MRELIKSEYEDYIFQISGRKVMVDADLALLYGVNTKALKQQVKRNQGRFPVDFMFEVSTEEKTELVTNCDRLAKLKHSSVNPYVFTEQGVSMLSSVLRSEKAIEINIEIMQAFVRYRSLISESEILRKDLKSLDSKLNEVFKFLLQKIDALHQKKHEEREPIGFKK